MRVMKYTKLAIERKEEELTSPALPISHRIGVTFMRVMVGLLIAAIVAGTCGGYGAYQGVIANAPDVATINIAPTGFATFIYDANGNQLQKLTSSDSNRISVSLKDVPLDLQHAIVATEDKRFYEHHGVDPHGMLRALSVGIRSRFRRTEGASTITQQLLKNNVFTEWTQEKGMMAKIRRKIQEQYLAVKLEERLHDKDLILENYLNTINLGAGTYGVEAAAKKYFHKSVSELNLSECTVLAGITLNPSLYNPISHPEKNADRRELVLRRMLDQGYITQEQRDEVLRDNVYEEIRRAQELSGEDNQIYSYFIDELTEQVRDDLMNQKGYTEREAYRALYSGGLRIYTTQDMAIQQICDEEYQNPDNYPEGTYFSIDWALSITRADGTTVHFSKEQMRKWYRENEDESFDLLFDSEEDGQAAIDHYKEEILTDGDTVIAERTAF